MTACVYRIRNTVTGKSYYGSTEKYANRKRTHEYSLNRGDHHCVSLQKDWKRQKGKGFRFKILSEHETREEAFIVEANLILKQLERNKAYNILAGGKGGDAYTHHPEYAKLLKRRKKAMQKYFANLTDEEKRAKYGKLGEKNGNWRGGHKFFCDCGNPIHTGNKTCSECRDRTGSNNPFFGKKHSAKTRKILSKANKGKLPSNSRKVIIDGVTYPSATGAARELGLSGPALVLFRIKSENKKFENYSFAE